MDILAIISSFNEKKKYIETVIGETSKKISDVQKAISDLKANASTMTKEKYDWLMSKYNKKIQQYQKYLEDFKQKKMQDIENWLDEKKKEVTKYQAEQIINEAKAKAMVF